MKIEFCGAAQQVTGSKHIIEVNGSRILLDCGLFQGRRRLAEKWNRELPFKADSIDALVLSHAHIDHCGAIPLLVKLGFTGPIYCTHATRDLCALMLRDSAFIHERDAEWIKKKGKDPNAEPLYTVEDAERSLSLFRSVNYHQPTEVARGAQVEFLDAGHILGSALELWKIYDEELKQNIRFGFTGDVGRKDLPILKDVETLENLDFLISESTYGNRLHDELKDIEEPLAQKIVEAYNRGGKIIIPSFAVGRTQEVLYIFMKLMKESKIPQIPIFVDSPLAQSATEVFRIHPECYDKELKDVFAQGVDPFCDGCNNISFTHSVEESKGLNDFKGSCIIISASGMCEFGRIRHHLFNHIGNEKNLIMFIGFQAQNTLGRKILEGENPVNIFGEAKEVRAEVVVYNAFSGHADQRELLDFISKAGPLRNVFLVHGEEDAQKVLIEKIKDLHNISPDTSVLNPSPGEIFELTADKKFVKSKEVNPLSQNFYQ